MRFCSVMFVVLTQFSGAAMALTLFTEENPPLNYTDGGKVVGVSTAVVSEMAKRAGLPVDIKLLPWEQGYSQVQSNPDSCIYSTARRPARNALFQWVGPIARSTYSAFGLPGFPDKPAKVDELKKYRIGVVNDARADYLKSRGFDKLVEAPSDVAFPGRLTADPAQAGGVDLWVTQSAGAREIARKAGVNDIKEVFNGIINQDYWLACNLQMPKEQARALMDALIGMHKDGTHRTLTQPAPAAR